MIMQDHSAMSNSHELRIEPVAPTSAAAPIQSAHRVPEVSNESKPADPKLPVRQDMSVVSNGHVHAAYTEFVVDPETHDVVVRIRDAATDRVLDELPSAQMQAVHKAMAEYAEKMALRRAALQASAGA
jgi:hypothetical protein